MIHISLYLKDDVLWRFRVSGHSGYAEAGADIVCASVTILVFNTINSIMAFTKEVLSVDEVDRSQGVVDCSFPNRKSGQSVEGCTLLLQSMIQGLHTIEEMYGEYISIKTIKMRR